MLGHEHSDPLDPTLSNQTPSVTEATSSSLYGSSSHVKDVLSPSHSHPKKSELPGHESTSLPLPSQVPRLPSLVLDGYDSSSSSSSYSSYSVSSPPSSPLFLSSSPSSESLSVTNSSMSASTSPIFRKPWPQSEKNDTPSRILSSLSSPLSSIESRPLLDWEIPFRPLRIKTTSDYESYSSSSLPISSSITLPPIQSLAPIESNVSTRTSGMNTRISTSRSKSKSKSKFKVKSKSRSKSKSITILTNQNHSGSIPTSFPPPSRGLFPSHPHSALIPRASTPVTLPDGRRAQAISFSNGGVALEFSNGIRTPVQSIEDLEAQLFEVKDEYQRNTLGLQSSLHSTSTSTSSPSPSPSSPSPSPTTSSPSSSNSNSTSPSDPEPQFIPLVLSSPGYGYGLSGIYHPGLSLRVSSRSSLGFSSAPTSPTRKSIPSSLSPFHTLQIQNPKHHKRCESYGGGGSSFQKTSDKSKDGEEEVGDVKALIRGSELTSLRRFRPRSTFQPYPSAPFLPRHSATPSLTLPSQLESLKLSSPSTSPIPFMYPSHSRSQSHSLPYHPSSSSSFSTSNPSLPHRHSRQRSLNSGLSHPSSQFKSSSQSLSLPGIFSSTSPYLQQHHHHHPSPAPSPSQFSSNYYRHHPPPPPPPFPFPSSPYSIHLQGHPFSRPGSSNSNPTHSLSSLYQSPMPPPPPLLQRSRGFGSGVSNRNSFTHHHSHSHSLTHHPYYGSRSLQGSPIFFHSPSFLLENDKFKEMGTGEGESRREGKEGKEKESRILPRRSLSHGENSPSFMTQTSSSSSPTFSIPSISHWRQTLPPLVSMDSNFHSTESFHFQAEWEPRLIHGISNQTSPRQMNGDQGREEIGGIRGEEEEEEEEAEEEEEEGDEVVDSRVPSGWSPLDSQSMENSSSLDSHESLQRKRRKESEFEDKVSGLPWQVKELLKKLDST